MCDGCGQDYNRIHNPPVVEDQCDVCGAALVRRPDDNEQAVSDRLSDYHSQTEPVLELFRRKELVIDVDGTQSIDDVQNEIRSKLDLTPYVPGESAS